MEEREGPICESSESESESGAGARGGRSVVDEGCFVGGAGP